MVCPVLIPNTNAHGNVSGFFLHVAFPSSEIFRCLSVREPLLRGLLGADLIGFQTASFARHFRQTVSRILSVEALPRGIQLPSTFELDEMGNPKKFYQAGEAKSDPRNSPMVDRSSSGDSLSSPSASNTLKSGRGRFVDVGVFPMGIDVKQLKEKLQVTDLLGS